MKKLVMHFVVLILGLALTNVVIAQEDPLPDLTITSLEAPASANTQEWTEVSWTVVNQGSGTAIGSSGYYVGYGNVWYDSLYLSQDNVLDDSDKLLANIGYLNKPLAAGESYTQTQQVIIPNVSTGNYYLLVKTDPSNYVYETNEDNNTLTQPITINVPDLTVSSLNAPASASTQQQVEISWTVKNQGSGTAIGSSGYYGGYGNVWYDNLYLSTDNVLDDSDKLLANIGYLNKPLAAGENYTTPYTIKIPEVPTGDYYLLLQADSQGNNVYESNEDNNIIVKPITIRVPDLTVTFIQAPTTVSPQQQIEISWTIKNQGNGDAVTTYLWTGSGYGWYLGKDILYLSTDEQLDDNDQQIASLWHAQPLPAGESYTETTPVTISNLPAGTYYLILKTDESNTIYESDGTNNISGAKPITITVPDLIPTSLTAPVSASTQQQVEFTWTIKNQGSGPTPLTSSNGWLDKVYLSMNEQLDSSDQQLVFRVHSQSLPAGQSYTETASVTIPNLTVGNYYLLAKVDEGNYIYESSEWNNVSSRLITIGEKEVLSETTSSELTLTEELLSQKAISSNLTVTGDLTGAFNFTGFEIAKVNSGSFLGRGLTKGQWNATLEGIFYQGAWQGVLFPAVKERKIYLKGVISGSDAGGIIDGYLTESIPESGVYDQYHAIWKLNQLADKTVFVTLNLAGSLNYLQTTNYPAVKLNVLQIAVTGKTTGHYNEPIDTVLNHLRVADTANPYNGQGCSIISYVAKNGSGEGWTFDELTVAGKISLLGQFSSPLLGIVSGSLDGAASGRTLSLSIERIDLALSPAPELRVKVWGPQNVSPGQTVNYIIEYRNDGVKGAEETILFVALDDSVKYISASERVFYNDILNTVDWNLGNLPAKSSGYLSVKTEVAWGLSQGTNLEVNAIINELIPHSEKKGIFVNGIGLYVTIDGNKQIDQDYAKVCTNFASSRDLEWVEAYNTGSGSGDVREVVNAFNGVATEHNGLLNNKVTGGFEYETVWGYSGGTRTLVTAIVQGKLKTKELVLISPVMIAPFELEALHILGVEKIIIYQSNKDKLPPSFINLYQLKITKDDPLRNQPWLEVRDRDSYEHYFWLQHLLNENNKNKENMSSSTPSIIITARDPNELSVAPSGDVKPGDTLTYIIHYENEGKGIAYGVYFTDTLEEDLDDSNLTIGPILDSATGKQIGASGIYNPVTRTISWFVGEVASKQGGSATFSVKVKNTTPDKSEVINYATVYFPSVPEATRTNGTVNKVTTSVDNIPPATTASISPEPNTSGWNNADITVNLTAIDNETGSGVAKTEYSLDATNWTTYTTSFAITSEGTTTVSYKSTDNAGNIEPLKTLTVKLDKTPPIITAATLPQPNANGWNNTDVTVTFTATDTLSGVDVGSITPLQLITSEGKDQHIGGQAFDLAGNQASTYVTLNIDKTKPAISITSPRENKEYFHTEAIPLTYTTSDVLSQIASTSLTLDNIPIISSSHIQPKVGTHTLIITTTDKAGNQAVLNRHFTVKLKAKVIIKPEAFLCNRGIFLAFVEFPQGYDVKTITDATCDGASAKKIIPLHHNTVLLLFRREDITVLPIDTTFTLRGHFSKGLLFEGTDTIKKIISHPRSIKDKEDEEREFDRAIDEAWRNHGGHENSGWLKRDIRELNR